MKHIQWLESLPPAVQGQLEFWKRAPAPQSANQDHYTVEAVAEGLRLSPVTVREYIREGTIFARKIGKRWQIPADAVARYLYNANPQNKLKADDDIPMGAITSYYCDNLNEQILDYKIVSNNEMNQFSTEEDLAKFMGYPYGKPSQEIEPFTLRPSLLERLGIITPSLRFLTKEKAKISLGDDVFDMPPILTKELMTLVGDDWRNMPLPLLELKYSELFSKKPDLNDLRLFKIALEYFESHGYTKSKGE